MEVSPNGLFTANVLSPAVVAHNQDLAHAPTRHPKMVEITAMEIALSPELATAILAQVT